MARDAARKQLVQAIDPNAAKRQAWIEASIRAGNSFAIVTEELIEKKAREGRSVTTLDTQRWLLKLLGKDFSKRPVVEITPRNCSMNSKSMNGGGGWRLPSGSAHLRGRFSVMRRQPHGPSVTLRSCYKALWFRRRSSTSPQLRTRLSLVPCCGL